MNDATPVLPRIAIFYPWGDFTEGRSGSSIRTGSMAEFLAPHAAGIRVLDTGNHARIQHGPCIVEGISPRSRLRKIAGAFYFGLFSLVLRHSRRETNPLWWHIAPRFDQPLRRRIEAYVEWADIVLLEYPFWMDLVAPACRRYNKPLVVTIHDILSAQAARGDCLHAMTEHVELAAIGKADHVIAMSKSDQTFLVEKGINALLSPVPAPQSRASMPPKTALSERLQRQYGISLPASICLFVGSNHLPNIEAVAVLEKIAASLDDARITFIVAGKCAEKGTGRGLQALGQVDEFVLQALHELADIIVIPLTSGTGTSIKTVEAMAAGKTVLGTSVAFRNLDVRSGHDCIVEDNLAAYPDIIKSLLDDPERRMALGHAARETMSRNTPARVFQPYLDIIGANGKTPA